MRSVGGKGHCFEKNIEFKELGVQGAPIANPPFLDRETAMLCCQIIIAPSDDTQMQ